MVIQRIEPEALAAEDRRLTANQAARIAEQLARRQPRRLTASEAAANGEAGRSRSRSRSRDEQTAARALRQSLEDVLDPALVMARVLEDVLALVPSATGAAIELAPSPAGPSTLAWAVGSLASDDGDAGARVRVPLSAQADFSGALVVEADGGPISGRDTDLLRAVGQVAAAALAAAAAIADATASVLGRTRTDPTLTALVARTLGPVVDRHLGAAQLAARIRQLIDTGGLDVVFQPIAALDRTEVVGYEALARFPSDPERPIETWFADAAAVGLGTDLELAAIEEALSRVGALPVDAFIAVNVSPATAVSPRFETCCAAIEPERLVIEVTEHAPVDDYVALTDALAALRARGVRLAIDDAGAGFASLRHVLRLNPDLIKLDISLTRRIDTDPVRRALATSLIAFAAEVGATILAEGIESRWELEALRRLGVRYGQGYHLARPAPLP